MSKADLTLDDPILTRLTDRFELRERVGQGGMATVYLAFDKVARCDVALKILHPHLRQDPLITERFRREIAAARRIASPHAIPVFDIIEEPLALVMAFCPGIDLKRALRRQGPMAPEAVIRIGDQLLDALAAAHDQGIVHRDVKPHNVLIDDQGDAHLTDFGLARVDDLVSVTTHTMTLGTPEYMAPELLDGTLVDGRADLYSLGATLYEALTGKLPFTASSPMELLRLHDTQPPPDPRRLKPDTPAPLADALLRAMAKDPDDRFPTAADMRRALRAHVDQPPKLPPASPCLKCRAPIPPGLTLCVECGHTAIQIGRTPGRGWGVLVRKASQEKLRDNEDTLTFQQKHATCETLKNLGGHIGDDGLKLDKRLRLPPVIAADRLVERDALLIFEALKARDVPVKLLSPSSPWRILHFVARSNAPAAAFIALIGFAITFTIIKGTALVPLAAVGWIAALLLMSFWGYRHATRPLALFTNARAAHRHNAALSQRARQTFEDIRSPRLRQLARRILTRGLALQSDLALRRDVPDQMSQEVEEAMMRSMTVVSRIATLEAEIAARTPAELHEEMETLNERMAAEDDMDEVEAIIHRKVALTSELADMDARQAELSRCASRLLEASSQLTALSARLRDDDPLDHDDAQALAAILGDLDASDDAQRQLDAEVQIDAAVQIASAAARQ